MVDMKIENTNGFLIFTTLVAVLPSITYGYALGYSSPVEVDVIKELKLSKSEYSLFGSLLTIGGLVAASICGTATDYLGRKRAYFMADVFSIVGWLLIAVSKEAWMLDLGRLSVGFSLGLFAYLVPIYVAEITPESIRGSFVFVHMLLICAGITAVYLLGLCVSWRILAGLGCIPNFAQIIGLIFIPESPRWLVKMGKDVEFESALQRLRGVSVNISQEADAIMGFTLASEQQSKVTFRQLFQKRYARGLIVGVGLMLFSQLCGYPAIIYYAATVFKSAGFSAKIGTIAVAVIQIPTGLVAVFLMDKCGRRPLLMISTVGLVLGSLLCAFSFVLQDHHWLTRSSPYLMLVGVLFFSAIYAIGLGGTVDIMLAELFPVNVKGMAGSLCMLVGWSASWAVTFAFNFCMDWSGAGTFFIMAGISTITVVFVAVLAPETKGRSLEEINASMSQSR